MPARLPWVQRKFAFEFSVDTYPDVLVRFRGTPPRTEDLVRGLDPRALTWSDGQGWTIQQNIGHLVDLEPLWDGRMDDYLAGKPELRAADMTNLRTNQANHNARAIGDLLGELRRERERQAARLEALAPSDFARVAVHPRLKQPLRLVDALTFVCCHDDYHLARIAELALAYPRR